MKKIFLVLVFAFIMIQFFQIDKTNPAVNQGTDFLKIKNTPPKIASQIKSSCYDCHSNESTYPWYSYVQPFGWVLQDHIKEGRKHLNFSEFATYEPKKQAHKLEEAAEEIEKGEMPIESYTLMHKDAILSETKKMEVINYFKRIAADTKISNNILETDPNQEEEHHED